MLRRTRLFRFVTECFPRTLAESFPTSRTTPDKFIAAIEPPCDFHTCHSDYLKDLYTNVTMDDPFSEVLKFQPLGGVRYMVSAPFTFRGKCKRVPFLIDTGCAWTLVHEETFHRMGLDIGTVERVDDVSVGHHRLPNGVQVNRFTANPDGTPHMYGYLNLLGSDFLEVATPGLGNYLSEKLSKKYQPPPLDEVWVTDGAVSFPVTPVKPTVAYLKKAIMPNATPVEQAHVLIKHPDGETKMRDEDELRANIKYVFEAPQVKQ